MSLLLKALKQAESVQSATARTSHGADPKVETVDDHARERDWVEPPSLLFGNGNLGDTQPRRGIRWPRLSLVPAVLLVAGVIALGYGIWLYLALQPPAGLPPAGQVASAPAPHEAAQNAAPTMSPALSDAVPAQSRAPTTSAPPATTAPPSPEVAAPATPGASRRSQEPVHKAKVATPVTPPPGTPRPPLPEFHPDPQTALVGQAWAAYQRGALAEAQRLYTQAHARQASPDALLGLAAIAVLQNRDAEAQQLYREVLTLDPRNATAQAALLDLLGNTDDTATESRLKLLLEREPTPQLYQTLAGLYAAQGRWREAQAAYFEAWRGAPDNADYAYNLAVSLDALREYATALTYYEKALAAGGTHRFDRKEAAARVLQLQQAR